MKYALWAIAGLVVLVALVIGVGAYWTTHVKVDFNDPQVADNFKQNFNLSCVGNYQKRAKQGGGTISEEMLAKVDQACSCARDAVVAALAKREPMTVIEIAEIMKSDPELNAITKACSAQFGIENPT